MKKQLEEIRRLVDELEAEQYTNSSVEMPGFHALELPAVIHEIVDDLQPLLSPYEATFYWYLFRHSIAKSGEPILRISTRRLQKGVVKSARSGRAHNPIAEQKIRDILQELERLGAIRKEGEPNRDGTPYRVMMPDEIQACREYRRQRSKSEPLAEVHSGEIDFYNVRQNRLKVFERDEYTCRYCQKQLTRFTATLDHVTPVTEGGDNSFENLLTACLHCNSRKNRRPVSDLLAEN